nr:reverse transcriptase domain-containing protein [Tanacetum cinerariifolium]
EDSAETRPPRVIVYGYDGLPIQPVTPPSSDYVLRPKHPPSPDYVPDPKHPPSPVETPYVPEPEYLEYLAPSDDEAPLVDQPLPTDASPIAASPDYVADSDPEEDPEEDPEDDQADYPADGGMEPFEEDDEEEKGNLAPTDSSAVPITDTLEADMPPRKRACLTTPAPRFEIRESSAAGTARQPGPAESDLRRYKGVKERVTELDTTVRQRMNKFKIRFEEAQDDRALLRARVNTLFRDRPDHRRTAMLIDREAMYARKACAFSMDKSSAIVAHVRTLETQVKFASCTLQGSALTWWNSHMRTVGHDVAYAMPWAALKRMITDKYSPRGRPAAANNNNNNQRAQGANERGELRTSPGVPSNSDDGNVAFL